MANYLNETSLFNGTSLNISWSRIPRFPHFVLPYYLYGNGSYVATASGVPSSSGDSPSRSWSTTLIVVVAVAGYIALSILACLLYKCLKRRGVRGPLCPHISCPKLPFFSGPCVDTTKPTCTTQLQTWWTKCCPTKMPNCEKIVTCHGMNMGCGWLERCKASDGRKWLPKWKTPAPKAPLWLKNYCAHACCCCFQNGNCRFLCLECKVRTDNNGQKTKTAEEEQQAASNGHHAQNMTPYPYFPGMTYPYVTSQPGGQAWSTTASATPPMQSLTTYPTVAATYQPISFLNQQYSWARPMGPSGSPFLPHSPSPQPFQYSPSPLAFRSPPQPLAHSLANATTDDTQRAAQTLISATNTPPS